VDSLLFTTDILTFAGDTLKAGHNFAHQTRFLGYSGNWRFDSTFTVRFRDSLFEVRFTGTVDTMRKSATQAVRITSPALLLH
jgi:hypothetical protein